MIGFSDDGKPKRKLVYGKTQKEVADKANELRLQFNMGIKLDDDTTVEEWAGTWLRTYKSGVSYNTNKMYEDIIKLYVKPTFGHLRLKDLKTAHIQKIINDNQEKHRSMEIFLLTITQILNQAMINDLIIKNPALGANLPAKVTGYGKRALTDDETKKLDEITLDAKTNFFVNLLRYTGMRKGEALAITKRDVDFNENQITVNKTLIFKGNTGEIKPNPKTKAGHRTIPILDPFRPILADYINLVNGEYLFTTQTGELMTDTAYRRMWQKFENAMGTKEITAHIFRHNFATILYNADVDVKAAQAIMGHSSITVMMDIYTHLDKKHKNKAASKLNEYFK